MFTDVEARELRRRYTITRVDPDAETLVLEGVLHGDGPGAAWFAGAEPGAEIDVVGPRGQIELGPPGVHHVLVGDESGLPAFAEVLRSLPSDARATAVIEVASAAEEQPIETVADVELRWVHRDGRPTGRADLLIAALAELEPFAPPVQAYVLGESRTIVALAPALARLGVGRAETFVKGYWNRPAVCEESESRGGRFIRRAARTPPPTAHAERHCGDQADEQQHRQHVAEGGDHHRRGNAQPVDR